MAWDFYCPLAHYLLLLCKMITDREGQTFIKVGPRGSTSAGEEWDDGALGQVRQIFLFHGDKINSIQTTYEKHGTTVVSARHGGNQGNFEAVCLDGPLTWVSGHYDSQCTDDELYFVDEDEQPYLFCKVIKSLKFGTSKRTYGPFGREVGEPFIYKATTGICGFHGRSDDSDFGWLYAIGGWVNTMANGVANGSVAPSTSRPAFEEEVTKIML